MSRLHVPFPPMPAPLHVLRDAWTKRRSLPRWLRGAARHRVVGVVTACLLWRPHVPHYRHRIPPRQIINAIVRIVVHPDGGWECALTEMPTLIWLERVPDRFRLPVLLRRRLGKRGVAALLQIQTPAGITWAAQRTGAWPQLLGRVIDRDPNPVVGTLYECRAPEVRARLLVVRCPTTGTDHVLTVPPEAGDTARDARRWTFHGAEPDIET